MVTVEQFSRIVTAVHDAAVEPDRWMDGLSLLQNTLGATRSGLVHSGASSSHIERCSVPDDEAMQAYRAYYHQFDYVMAAVNTSALGLVRSGAELVALKPRSEFHADWMRRYAMEDGLFVRISGEPDSCCLVVAAPRRDHSFASADNVRVANMLVPHFQRALSTQRTLSELHDRTRHHAHPVDSISVPAAVMGPDMTLSYSNRAFESLIRSSATFFAHLGRVSLTTSRPDNAFRHAVANATGNRPTGARTGDSLRVPRAGLRPLIVHVSPLRDQDRPCALVIVVDPDSRREPPKHLLRQLFSLTDSEAEVALRISRGSGLPAIADELSLSLATVKTHAQHAYQKTDTHRQAELVRLILTLIP